jgi:hypothetical protein
MTGPCETLLGEIQGSVANLGMNYVIVTANVGSMTPTVDGSGNQWSALTIDPGVGFMGRVNWIHFLANPRSPGATTGTHYMYLSQGTSITSGYQNYFYISSPYNSQISVHGNHIDTGLLNGLSTTPTTFADILLNAYFDHDSPLQFQYCDATNDVGISGTNFIPATIQVGYLKIPESSI